MTTWHASSTKAKCMKMHANTQHTITSYDHYIHVKSQKFFQAFPVPFNFKIPYNNDGLVQGIAKHFKCTTLFFIYCMQTILLHELKSWERLVPLFALDVYKHVHVHKRQGIIWERHRFHLRTRNTSVHASVHVHLKNTLMIFTHIMHWT